MSWLARLKNPQGPDTHPTKTTETISLAKETVFVVSVGTPDGHIPKSGMVAAAANDPTSDAERWCWPHSSAMNSREIDTFTDRLARFTDKGLDLDAGERWADKLVTRDRETDDRWLCLECVHLAGHAGSWGCRAWQRAEVAVKARDAGLDCDVVQLLQRCDGFKGTAT